MKKVEASQDVTYPDAAAGMSITKFRFFKLHGSKTKEASKFFIWSYASDFCSQYYKMRNSRQGFLYMSVF